MRLEIPVDFCEDPRFDKFPAEQKPIATVIKLLCTTAKDFPDGFRPDINTVEGVGRMLADKGWLDSGPTRVHNWMDYANAGLRNQCRKGKRRAWYVQTVEKWKALGWKPGVFPNRRSGVPDGRPKRIAPPATSPAKAPTMEPGTPDALAVDEALRHKPEPRANKEPVAEPEQLQLNGEKAAKPKRILTNEQKIIEKFAEVKKLDFSTPAAQKIVVRGNVRAAKEINEVTGGDMEAALVFVELATAEMDDKMAAWKEKDGEDHPWRQLAAILPMWSEFKQLWDARKKPAEAKTSELREKAVPEG